LGKVFEREKRIYISIDFAILIYMLLGKQAEMGELEGKIYV